MKTGRKWALFFLGITLVAALSIPLVLLPMRGAGDPLAVRLERYQRLNSGEPVAWLKLTNRSKAKLGIAADPDSDAVMGQYRQITDRGARIWSDFKRSQYSVRWLSPGQGTKVMILLPTNGIPVTASVLIFHSDMSPGQRMLIQKAVRWCQERLVRPGLFHPSRLVEIPFELSATDVPPAKEHR